MTTVGNVFKALIVCGVFGLLASCKSTTLTYTVSGHISGANPATTVVIILNGTSGIAMVGDGSFKFANQLNTGETFNVQIIDASDRCTVANGAGTVAKTDITGVSILCGPQTTQSVIRSANLLGVSEVPPVATSASGVGGVIVSPNPSAQSPITGGITFSGLTSPVTAAQIHQTPLGVPGGIGATIVTLTVAADGATAIVPAGTTLAPDQYTSLLAGELYFEVRTTTNGNGEIRGQIQLQGGVAASAATLDQSQVVVPPALVATAASGKGTLLADLATGRILISYITHTVANTTTAEIHTSPVLGSNGPSIVPFANLQPDGLGNNLSTPSAGTMMTAQNIADFQANLLYFNVASTLNPSGEIRGNISPQ